MSKVFGDGIAAMGIIVLLPIGTLIQLWRNYKIDSEIQAKSMNHNRTFKLIKGSIIRCVVVIPVTIIFFILLNLIIGQIVRFTEIIYELLSDNFIVVMVGGIFAIALMIAFLAGCAYYIPRFIINVTKKICKIPYDIKVKILNNKYEIEKDKIIKEYENKLNILEGEFKEDIISLKNNYMKFNCMPYYVHGSIEQYDEKNLGVVLYNELEDENEKVDDFIFYGNNDEKADYFVELEKYINEEYKADSIKDLMNIPSIYKMNKLDQVDNLIRYSHELSYSMRMFLLDEFIYTNIDEMASLKESIESYLSYRETHINDLSKSSNIGKIGEDSVNSYLDVYDDEIINLKNIRLEVDGNSIENDNILITRYGIFVVEVKNIGSTGSYSIEIEKDGRWLKRFNNNKSEVIDFDATMQNDRHIAYLQKFINKKLGRNVDNYININGIVAIANNKINISNYSDQPVLRASELYRYISKNKIMFNYEEMKSIEKIILEENLPPKVYPMVDFKKELNYNISYINKITHNINLEYLETLEAKIMEYKSNENNLDLHKRNRIFSIKDKLNKEIISI